MWGPKCEEVQKPWVLQLKHWSLSMHVSDEDGIYSISMVYSIHMLYSSIHSNQQ